jgi:uncharacterized protein (UPF0332 family)
MAHAAKEYLSSQWLGYSFKQDDVPPPLNSDQAHKLRQCLKVDANEYYVAGLLSYFDAVGRLEQQAWSWSIVKLYYSVFYFARSYLAASGFCVFSTAEAKKMLWVGGSRGEVPRGFPKKRSVSPTDADAKKTLTGSHGTVLYLLQKEFPRLGVVDQEIEGLYPTEWMSGHRERANYTNGSFPDPIPPSELMFVDRVGVRKCLSYYLSDRDFVYTFDPDHALLAYPSYFMDVAFRKVNEVGGVSVEGERASLLSRLAKDSSGPFSILLENYLGR